MRKKQNKKRIITTWIKKNDFFYLLRNKHNEKRLYVSSKSVIPCYRERLNEAFRLNET